MQPFLYPTPPEEIKAKINDLIIRSYELRDESNDLIDEATQLLIKELRLPPIEEFEKNTFNSINAFSIKLSEMKNRADSSYHVPIVNKIIAHLHKYSDEVTTICDKRISSAVVLPGRFKRVYVDSEYGTKFLGGKEMRQLNPSTEKYLSKCAHKKQLEGSLGIKEYSILTPARGSLGDVKWKEKDSYDHDLDIEIMVFVTKSLVSRNICNNSRKIRKQVDDLIGSKFTQTSKAELLKIVEDQQEIGGATSRLISYEVIIYLMKSGLEEYRITHNEALLKEIIAHGDNFLQCNSSLHYYFDCLRYLIEATKAIGDSTDKYLDLVKSAKKDIESIVG